MDNSQLLVIVNINNNKWKRNYKPLVIIITYYYYDCYC